MAVCGLQILFKIFQLLRSELPIFNTQHRHNLQ